MVEIKLHDGRHAFDNLESDWRRLTASDDRSGVFNGWDWNSIWWQHYAHLGKLLLLSAEIDGVVQGIAPFYQTNLRSLGFIRTNTLRFVGSGGDTSPDDLDVLANPEYMEPVLDSICNYLLQQSALTRFSLQDVPSESLFLRHFLSHARHLPDPLTRKQQRRVAKLPDTVEAYTAGLSRNARKHRKRRMNRLMQSGEIQFDQCRTLDEVEQSLQKLVSLHHLRRATKGDTKSFDSSNYVNFHRSLMQALLKRDELRLVSLKIGNKVVAVEYAYFVNGVLAFFQTGFDPEYQHLSPGHVMMNYMIDEAIGEQAAEVDMLKGDYDYKASYASQWRQSVSIELWRNPIIAGAHRLARALRSG